MSFKKTALHTQNYLVTKMMKTISNRKKIVDGTNLIGIQRDAIRWVEA